MTIGIYAIINKLEKKVYLGRSVNVERRIKEHKRLLNNNSHYNKVLNKDWYSYGENAFDFQLIQECSKTEIELLEKEYISRYRKFNLYNFNWRNHPWSKVGYFTGRDSSGKSSRTKYTTDQDGDRLPLIYCPNCNLFKLSNSFIDSIYCLECSSVIDAEEINDEEIFETISFLGGTNKLEEKPVLKYKIDSSNVV